MDKKEIREKAIESVRKHFVFDGPISDETSFTADINCDSLELIEFSMNIEDDFGIQIPGDEFNEILTVGLLVEYLDKKLKS